MIPAKSVSFGRNIKQLTISFKLRWFLSLGRLKPVGSDRIK